MNVSVAAESLARVYDLEAGVCHERGAHGDADVTERTAAMLRSQALEIAALRIKLTEARADCESSGKATESYCTKAESLRMDVGRLERAAAPLNVFLAPCTCYGTDAESWVCPRHGSMSHGMVLP